MLDALKLPPSVKAVIAAVCAAVLYLPKSWREASGIDALSPGWRLLVFVAGSVMLLLLVVDLVRLVWDSQNSKRERLERAAAEAEKQMRDEQRARAAAQAIVEEREKRLHRLARDEKAVLLKFVSAERRAVLIDIPNGAFVALCNAGILRQASEVITFVTGQDRCEAYIEPWALEYLLAHPDLVTS